MRGGMGHGRGWRRIPWLQGPPWPAESGAPAEARPGGGPGAPPAGRRRPVVGTRFAEPFLLLLLAEGPSHGYDLLERLAGRGFVAGEVDAGYLYRTLRGMEEAGLVTSEWDSASRGPIKRTYAITASGEQALHAWAEALAEHSRALQRFLESYGARFPQGQAR